MAQIYTIRCPKCGREFEAMKGILMSECDKPIPEDRKEETPVVCPICGLELTIDEAREKGYIQSVIMAD